jgi:hypothetical protein
MGKMKIQKIQQLEQQQKVFINVNYFNIHVCEDVLCWCVQRHFMCKGKHTAESAAQTQSRAGRHSNDTPGAFFFARAHVAAPPPPSLLDQHTAIGVKLFTSIQNRIM